MWLSYHFERKVLEYALSLSWETSHCNCKPELENSLSCWFQLISPKPSPIVASCLPKWQDESLCPNTSLKAHTLVKVLQVTSVFKCSPWFTRRGAAAVREQYRCKEQPATMKPGSNHILSLPGFICWLLLAAQHTSSSQWHPPAFPESHCLSWHSSHAVKNWTTMMWPRGPGPWHVIPQGPRARRKVLERGNHLQSCLPTLILGALLSSVCKPAAK